MANLSDELVACNGVRLRQTCPYAAVVISRVITHLSPTPLPNHCSLLPSGAPVFLASQTGASDSRKSMKLENLRGRASALRGALGLRDPTFSLHCRNYISAGAGAITHDECGTVRGGQLNHRTRYGR